MKRSSLFHDNSSFTAPVFNLLSPNFKKITTPSRKFYNFCIWIKTADVKSQGIKEGDRVMAYNDRGKVAMPADVTYRISDHQQSWGMRMPLDGAGATSAGGH
jgi:anaerobic selenocysteine-containing dehydrogenase